MTSRAKHPDVENFLILFAKIREATDDDPAHVEPTAKTDEAFRKLCDDLWWREFLLDQAEQEARELFATTVDPKFILAWRDYNARYSQSMAGVQLASMGIEGVENDTRSKYERDFESAEVEARESAKGIKAALALAEEEIDQEWRDFPDNYLDEIQQGLSEWRRLTVGIGFDLEGAFRRRNLIPFILIPHHISDKYGKSEPLSLYALLRQAHEAFVYGVPFAAISLLRSILEAVLRDHYKAGGSDLSEQIESASGLPRTVRHGQLHDLRKLANGILHATTSVGTLPLDLEKEIVGHLFVIRDLIEGHKPGATISKFSRRP